MYHGGIQDVKMSTQKKKLTINWLFIWLIWFLETILYNLINRYVSQKRVDIVEISELIKLIKKNNGTGETKFYVTSEWQWLHFRNNGSTSTKKIKSYI